MLRSSWRQWLAELASRHPSGFEDIRGALKERIQKLTWMSDSTKQSCIHCGTENINRIWNITFRTGGITPDYGQGTGKSSGGGSIEGSKSGCGSCVSKSCGTCH